MLYISCFLFLALSAIRTCSSTIEMGHDPIIYTKELKKGSILCINSSYPYFSIILNQWKYSSITTYRKFNNTMRSDGPYTSNSEYGGFDFGATPGSAEIEMTSNGLLSIGMFVFAKNLDIRIISNHKKDEVIFDSDTLDSLDLGRDQLVQYFNTSPGKREYKVDINCESQDYISFRSGPEPLQKKFNGVEVFERSNDNQIPEVVEIKTDSNSSSDHITFCVTSPDFKSSKYVRHVTNGKRYQPLLSFKYDHLSVGAIVGIVIACIVVAVAVATLIAFVFFKNKKKNKNKDFTNDDSTVGNVQEISLNNSSSNV